MGEIRVGISGWTYAGWRGASTADGVVVFLVVAVVTAVCWAAGRRLSTAADGYV